MKKLFNISIICLVLLTGCASTKKINVQVLASYPYEGVYDKDVSIVLNGSEIIRGNKADPERIWILSDRTLIYILESTRNAKIKTTEISNISEQK